MFSVGHKTMPTSVSGEYTSKSGAVAGADDKERPRFGLWSEGKQGQKHDVEVIVEHTRQVGAQEGQKRERTQSVLDLESSRENNFDSSCCGWVCSD